MLQQLDLTNVLSIDIETVPQKASYNELDDHWKKLWDIKSKQKYPEQTPEESYPKAGIFAEFGKIVCISVGAFVRWGKSYQLKVKSYYGHDEAKLLEDFRSMLEKYVKSPMNTMAAHNGREFDYPYIGRRMVINRVEVPFILDLAGRKPWEINLIDTMDLWKFGDIKAYTSLVLLATALDIPTPKDDIDGSMVHSVYWKDNDLERIRTYCQKDVATLSRLLLRYKGETDLLEQNIIIA